MKKHAYRAFKRLTAEEVLTASPEAIKEHIEDLQENMREAFKESGEDIEDYELILEDEVLQHERISLVARKRNKEELETNDQTTRNTQ